ncbi:molybdopterin-dependent oxidoreductase [Slackia heliotrinireducens]|uniref:Nitrate reductase n=1 Tax=Slackia heliotrinireducens (strain ATCC 29202 / DSM 20476 / NCTC 11029 / RHS 1) TaxID=471855 RepID=C7N4I0_SLAHD|nr:molybdopterin-dependent oxidoreductase [Slackia heliotrinireducens]ACV21815.1 anaerobic dehydrogenase, typically selenocysteine-containing [Slackia heliotrinireducens DSM 20476]VEG99527.1 Periplasmic nitrate reductase precursor [Slackia heliotrinireducens]
MDLSRRAFVKSSAVAAAMMAAGGSLAAMAGCSNGGSTDAGGDSAATGNIEVKSAVCRYCGCGCGVLVSVADGKVIQVAGDPDCQSNLGLNCIKGYYLGSLLYGENRLTKPMIRDDAGTKGTGEGLREAEWDEVLDLVASKLKETWKNDKSRLAFWGSGQQPITEGYLQSKFWKAGLLSNNIDPNARMCMASAVVGFMNVFGTDEPAGCYSDIDNADVFITWGANMAEAHPMLFSRVSARKLADENVKHIDITTLKTRTSTDAEHVLLFRPGTDLAITNCIMNYLIKNDTYDKQFVADHLQFKMGTENIGYPYEDGYDKSDIGSKVDETTPCTFEEFAARLEDYTLEYTSNLSGVSQEDLQMLIDVFSDPELRVMSLWTMGVNQHHRGTWMNHNLHNLHLISGKYGKPGCTAFSLTGQPSACGTAREVGTFCHRLPADLVVKNPVHRRYTEAVWDLPEGYLDAIETPGFHTIKMFREMSKGNIDFLWSAHNNWAQSLPNLTRFLGMDGEHEGIFDTFIVVNEVYPTITCDYADVVLPAALWVEREGQFGNAERRTSVFQKCVEPMGEAKWDVWIMMQIAQRVLEGEKIGDADAFDHLFGFIWDKEAGDFIGDDRETNRAIWEEYRIFSNPEMKDTVAAINTENNMHMEAKQLAPYDEYIEQHGLTWPVREVDGKWLPTKWRFTYGDQAEGYDQIGIEMYGQQGLANDMSFYKTPDQKPSVVFRPYEPPAEEPDADFPFWFCTGRLLEHWHTGSMTRNVAELDRALPEALLNMNPADMEKLGLKDRDRVRVTSRHGSFEITVSNAGRTEPPEGLVFAPFFARETLINLAVHDYYCPLSKETDYKKTCVQIEKA